MTTYFPQDKKETKKDYFKQCKINRYKKAKKLKLTMMT